MHAIAGFLSPAGHARRKWPVRTITLAVAVSAWATWQISTATHASAEGALATGQAPGRSWTGFSINKSTAADARSAAVQACQSRGEGCTVKLTFRNACFALAYQHSGSGFWAATR